MKRETGKAMQEFDFDLIIIGAGINGAGIALDAATRGYRVFICDKNDFGAGTTSASSRLIHGGLRYLEYFEIGLVQESLRERDILLRTAAGLVAPLKLLIPVYKTSRRPLFLIKIGMLLYDLLSLGKKLPRHHMLTRASLLKQEPALKSKGLRGGAAYFDSQVAFPERLCWSIIHKARRAGACAQNYCKAVGFEKVRGGHRVQVKNLKCGSEFSVSGRMLINATGPWVDEVRKVHAPNAPALLGGTKGSHIIIAKRPDGPKHAIYVEAQQDGRPFFIIPWLDFLLIGTTDINYTGDLDTVIISQQEVGYLLTEVNHILGGSQITEKDILFTCSGVRPLPAAKKGNTGAITRRHHIKKGEENYFDIIGGKLTTWRSLAEQAVDKMMHLLPENGEGSEQGTAEIMLAEGSELPVPGNLPAINACAWQHISALHGPDAHQILKLVKDNPELGRPISAHRPDMLAQAVFAAQNEEAHHLADILLRRTTAGYGPDMGLICCEKVAEIVAPQLSWNKSRQQDEIQKYREFILTHHIPEFLPAGKKWRQKCGL